MDRILNWEGCSNVRDLGGLPALNGRQTRRGALVRADTPSKLTTAGWQALQAHGIRTILTLRTEGHTEKELDLPALPPGIGNVSVAIEDLNDRDFLQTWAASELWCTPLYYRDALKRWPQRHAAGVAAFALAQPGGVLLHCVRGQDRTGILSILLLSLAGVSHEDILNDYELSHDPEREAILQSRGTSPRQVILDVLQELEAEEYLRSAGLSQEIIAAARERLLES